MATPRRIKIQIAETELTGQLNGSKTADRLWEQLPVSGSGLRWGDEIYFDITVRLVETDPKEAVGIGDIAYWEPGTSLCLFWGPTPASIDDQPRAASPVTVIGRIEGDPSRLASISDISRIRVSRFVERLSESISNQ